MLAVINASVTGGRQQGIITGLGLSTANIVWATLAVLGVETLFTLFPGWVFSLRILGALYLLWLGMNALWRAYKYNVTLLNTSAMQSNRRYFLQGFLVCASNPKAALFYGSIISAFVPDNASYGLLAGILVLCTVQSPILHTITAIVFSKTAVLLKFNQFQRAISTLFGAVFTSLGIGVLYDTLRKA